MSPLLIEVPILMVMCIQHKGKLHRAPIKSSLLFKYTQDNTFKMQLSWTQCILEMKQMYTARTQDIQKCRLPGFPCQHCIAGEHWVLVGLPFCGFYSLYLAGACDITWHHHWQNNTPCRQRWASAVHESCSCSLLTTAKLTNENRPLRIKP